MIKQSILKNRYIIIFVFASAIFILLFSYSTSPLYPYYYGTDSAQFLTVGKAWSLGKIPYIDVFDHKGPLIFFIDMLGFLISWGGDVKQTIGIMLIQIVFMSFTLIATNKIIKLYNIKSTLVSIVIIILTLISIKLNYKEGNNVEDYCLPFIIWSFYYIIRYFRFNIKYFGYKESIFIGITAGVCLLTRATNFAPLIIGVAAVYISCLYNKKYIQFYIATIGFLLGFLFLVIPFSLYFIINNCFIEYVNGMLLYNIEYTNARPSWLHHASSEAIRIYMKTYFLHYSIFIVAIICFSKKYYVFALLMLLTGLFEAMFYLSGDNFPQYPLVCLVQITILFCEIYDSMLYKHPQILFTNSIALVISLWFIANCVDSMPSARDFRTLYKQPYNRGWEELIAQVPNDKLDSFIAYGGNLFKEIYLLHNVVPCYRYFVIQEWQASMSNKTKNDIHNVFEYGNAEYLITSGSTNLINDILIKRYTKIDTKNNMSLYKLIQ